MGAGNENGVRIDTTAGNAYGCAVVASIVVIFCQFCLARTESTVDARYRSKRPAALIFNVNQAHYELTREDFKSCPGFAARGAGDEWLLASAQNTSVRGELVSGWSYIVTDTDGNALKGSKRILEDDGSWLLIFKNGVCVYDGAYNVIYGPYPSPSDVKTVRQIGFDKSLQLALEADAVTRAIRAFGGAGNLLIALKRAGIGAKDWDLNVERNLEKNNVIAASKP